VKLVRVEALRTRRQAFPTASSTKGYATSMGKYFGKQPVGRPRESREFDVNTVGECTVRLCRRTADSDGFEY
jgi:hypothetical protein